MIRSNVFGGIINLSRIHQKIVYRSCCTKSNEIVGLSHVDEIKNVPRMVDITRKITTSRQAHAQVSQK